MVWYYVGSIDEYNGIIGVVYMFEYMMFKGIKVVGFGEFFCCVVVMGGCENVMIMCDFMMYFQQIEKLYFGDVMVFEVDCMVNFQLIDKEFKLEMNVVKEECCMCIDDFVCFIVYEQMFVMLFNVVLYCNLIIGWLGDFDMMMVQDVQNWYYVWYMFNNVIVIVVGDVKFDEVFCLVQCIYGKFKLYVLLCCYVQEELKQIGVKCIWVKVLVENLYVVLVYKVLCLSDVEKDVDLYVLEVLLVVFDGYDNVCLLS